MNFVSNVKKACQWMENVSQPGFIPMPGSTDPYYEVTGYFVPTILSFGYKEKARKFCDYLVANQSTDGGWYRRAFDTAQVIDGLSEFNDYQESIVKGVNYIKSVYKNGIFYDRNTNQAAIPAYINLRVLSVLKKIGENTQFFQQFIDMHKECIFSHISHFYAYAFEGLIGLEQNVQQFVDVAKAYDGRIPVSKAKSNEYCYTGLSQFALCLFKIGEFDLGMKTLEFVTQFQNESGGFFGGTKDSNYFPNKEVSWAVKYYLDAFAEACRLSFANHSAWKADFEGGEHDHRLQFILSQIQPCDKTLEVGCGSGRYINRLPGDKYACDVRETTVDAKFSIGSFYNLPYEDHVFDKVICCECLEHAAIKENAIKEMLRVVKPGGLLLIVDKDFSKQNNYKLHFGEEWVDFQKLQNAEIIPIEGQKMPFLGAIIHA